MNLMPGPDFSLLFDRYRNNASDEQGLVFLNNWRLRDAEYLFLEQWKDETRSPGERLRALNLLALVEWKRFGFGPDSSAMIAYEIQRRWEMASRLRYYEQQRSALGVPLTASPEDHYVFELTRNIAASRYLARSMYLSTPGLTAQRRVQGAIQSAMQLRSMVPDHSSYRFEIDLFLAELWAHLGNSNASAECLHSAFSLAEAANDVVAQGMCRLVWGDVRSAPVSSVYMWNHHLNEGDMSNALAWNRENQEFNRLPLDLEDPLNFYGEALGLFEISGAVRAVASTYLRLAYVAAFREDYGRAFEYLQVALNRYTELGDELGMAISMTHLQLVQIADDPYVEVIAHSIGKWGSSDGSYSAALGLGILCARFGRFWLRVHADHRRALACIHAARAIFVELEAEDNVAQTYHDEADTHKAITNYIAHISNLDRAQQIFSSLAKDDTHTDQLAVWQKAVFTAQDLCSSALNQQNPDKLEIYINRLKHLLHTRPTTGKGLFGPHFPNTMQDALELWLQFYSVLVHVLRGTKARATQPLSKSDAHFEWALDLAGEASGQSDFLQTIVYRFWKRRDEAIAAFERFIDQGGTAAGTVGELATKMSTLFGPAGQEIVSQRGPETYKLAALFYTRQNAHKQAQQYLSMLEDQEGKGWWRQTRNPWEWLAILGEVAEGLEQLDAALNWYSQAIADFEQGQRPTSRDETRTALGDSLSAKHLYFDAARAAMKNKQPSRSFKYAEQGRARALIESIVASRVFGDQPKVFVERQKLSAQLSLLHHLIAQETQTPQPNTDRIQQLWEDIKATEAKLNELENRLFSQRKRKELSYGLDPDTLAQRLHPEEAMLVYNNLEDEMLCWAITKEGLQSYTRSPVDTDWLERTAFQIMEGCRKGLPLDQDTLVMLSSRLLDPFRPILEQYERLSLVPYHPLHLLPFAILPWNDSLLGMSHICTMLPNAGLKQFVRPSHPLDIEACTALIVGNPAPMFYPSTENDSMQTLAPLPYAEQEAEYIHTLYPHSTLMTADKATASSIEELIETTDLLHFATHAILDEDVPFLSSLMLAEGDTLSVYDLAGLNLNADLVILSGCNTGQGRTIAGGDVLGLTRSLLIAGAKSALVSLWPVNDYSAHLIMKAFHDAVVHERLDPAAALKVAQLAMFEQDFDLPVPRVDRVRSRFGRPLGDSRRRIGLDHPHHWAPFVLVG